MSSRAEKGSGKEWRAGRVRALRRHLKRTQQDLAQELGVRQQTISDWETGVYRPRGASRTLLNIVAERADFRYEVDSEDGADSEVPEA